MTLIDQGFTPAEAAESLGLDPIAVEIALAGERGEVIRFGDRQNEDELGDNVLEQLARKTLHDVMRNGESEGAKIMAAKLVLEGRAKCAKVNASKLSEYFEQMKRASAIMEGEVVECV